MHGGLQLVDGNSSDALESLLVQFPGAGPYTAKNGVEVAAAFGLVHDFDLSAAWWRLLITSLHPCTLSFRVIRRCPEQEKCGTGSNTNYMLSLLHRGNGDIAPDVACFFKIPVLSPCQVLSPVCVSALA